MDVDLAARARRHAALGEPARLAIVDELTVSDRAPIELREMLDIPGNLLAHHLDVLEQVGLIGRTKSSGDGRRKYVHLMPGALDGLVPHRVLPPGPALFVCTANSARSQLAAVLWEELVGAPAASAGTHPAAKVSAGSPPSAALVVTVCDRAHEELDGHPDWLHWSIPDPVPLNTKAAYDHAVDELRNRIGSFVPAVA